MCSFIWAVFQVPHFLHDYLYELQQASELSKPVQPSSQLFTKASLFFESYFSPKEWVSSEMLLFLLFCHSSPAYVLPPLWWLLASLIHQLHGSITSFSYCLLVTATSQVFTNNLPGHGCQHWSLPQLSQGWVTSSFQHSIVEYSHLASLVYGIWWVY